MNSLNLLSKKSGAKHQVLYRIYTEDREDYRDHIIQSLRNHGIADFTVAPAIGYGPGQDGRQESTAVIEVATDDSLPNLRAIRCVVDDINHQNNQQSVFVVAFPVAHSLVTSQEESHRQLPFEGILEPQRKLEDRFVRKPRIVARCGKWEMLLRVVRASIGEV
jgi:hypothetical protein